MTKTQMSRADVAARLDALDVQAACIKGRLARVRGHKTDGPLVPKLAPALLKGWMDGWAVEDEFLAEAFGSDE
jgi:hypothetical protein